MPVINKRNWALHSEELGAVRRVSNALTWHSQAFQQGKKDLLAVCIPLVRGGATEVGHFMLCQCASVHDYQGVNISRGLKETGMSCAEWEDESETSGEKRIVSRKRVKS